MIYRTKFFKLQELIPPDVYKKYGEFAWCFFDEDILKDLDTIREKHGAITINNWSFGGNLRNCGFRSNLYENSKLYCSAHCQSKAFDLHSVNNHKLYNDIHELFKQGKLKAIKRMYDLEGETVFANFDETVEKVADGNNELATSLLNNEVAIRDLIRSEGKLEKAIIE